MTDAFSDNGAKEKKEDIVSAHSGLPTNDAETSGDGEVHTKDSEKSDGDAKDQDSLPPTEATGDKRGLGVVECGVLELCNAFTDPPIIGLTEYGYCL